MQCQDAQSLMTAYIADEVTSVERRDLEAHVVGCACCHEELAGFRQAWDCLVRWSVPGPDVRLERELLARVEGERVTARPRIRPFAAGTAALAGVLLSIVASSFLPYERAFEFCRQALRRFDLFPGLPDSMLFFIAGALYGLIPLLLIGLVSGHLMGGRAPRFQGTATGLAFAILITPYVLIVCSALPGTFTAAILAGIGLGALPGATGGFWFGARAWRPAR